MRQYSLFILRMLMTALLFSCGQSNVSDAVPDQPDLRRGDYVSCGRESAAFGTTSFTAIVPDSLRQHFDMGVSLLHSFEYEEAEKAFAKVIDREPHCAMAWWGVAMANFHPLWAPPDANELKKGAAAVKIAQAEPGKTRRESLYIEAIARFYDSAAVLNHRTRVRKFESAMEKIHETYPDETDATVFYALSLDAAADPKDKEYVRQKKAFKLLVPLFRTQPLHPGVAHLIIHSCDYPALASMGVEAARKYAAIAPASAHAQHMPSHIFTRLGDWNECIHSNQLAAASAICYAEQAAMKGHWGEELHALDYLVYAYLQQGNNAKAKEQLDYVNGINLVSQQDFKTAHALAAIPARYSLENHDWKSASQLPMTTVAGDWQAFPWQQGIVRLGRILGLAHTGQLPAASMELDKLETLYKKLSATSDRINETALVKVQLLTARAWLDYFSNRKGAAFAQMKEAADVEDGMEKHPVTPGEVLPARELYADMLLLSGKPDEALHAYEEVLASHARRFNALYGAAVSARQSGNELKSSAYFKELISISDQGSGREELKEARENLQRFALTAHR